MDEKRALFVPRNHLAGYDCKVGILELNGVCATILSGCEIDLMDLMDVDRVDPTEFYVGDVLVRLNSLEFSRNYVVLTFEEAVEFMSSLPDFRRVGS